MGLFKSDLPDLTDKVKDKGGKRFNKKDPLYQLACNANLFIKWPGIENANRDPINAVIIDRSRRQELKHIYGVSGGTWVSPNKCVKITICGKLHRICISTQTLRLARYADAAVLYFWKYKSIDRSPEDSDFNTSLETAKQLLTVPQALFHLQTLEKFLIDAGYIQTEKEKAVEQRKHDFVRDMRVARKYLERSRRYTRLLGERYPLDESKSNAVAMVIANITASLEIFSSAIQTGVNSVTDQIQKEGMQ